jgi:hypothetical protein
MCDEPDLAEAQPATDAAERGGLASGGVRAEVSPIPLRRIG